MTRDEFIQNVSVYAYIMDARALRGSRLPRESSPLGFITRPPHSDELARALIYAARVPLDERLRWARRLRLKLTVEADHDRLEPVECEGF